MKFEDWIKYENFRLCQTDPAAWVVLDEACILSPPGEAAPPNKEKPPVWTMIVQVFNSRRI